MKKLALLIATFALVALAAACMWDSDTLAFESKQMPDTVDAITGRFDRNPPLYYQMRLDRVSKEVKTNPRNLELYDDAGVASDRLGRHDEAIAWMARKRKQLDVTPPGPNQKEHEYRYYANLGTFVVHRWFANGAKREQIKEVERSRNLLNQALKINPDAHFGRERVQVAIVKWLIQPSDFDPDIDINFKRMEPEQIVKGLTGLIVLGNAWQSFEVYGVLAEACTLSRVGGNYGQASLSGLAHLRMAELIKDGKKPIKKGRDDFNPDDPLALDLLTWQKEDLKVDYRKLRANADEYHQHRTDFMMARLKQGRHPDTDPNFWDDYKEVPRYRIPDRSPPLNIQLMKLLVNPWLCCSCPLLLGLGIFMLARRARLRRNSHIGP